MIYQFPNQDFISMTDYNFLYTVIASANVPPQGKHFLLFKHDQMQMGLSIVTNDTFFAPLAFDVQMVTLEIPHDTLPIHLHGEPIGGQFLHHMTLDQSPNMY